MKKITQIDELEKLFGKKQDNSLGGHIIVLPTNVSIVDIWSITLHKALEIALLDPCKTLMVLEPRGMWWTSAFRLLDDQCPSTTSHPTKSSIIHLVTFGNTFTLFNCNTRTI